MFFADDDFPMIFDTGASTSLSPNKEDFEDDYEDITSTQPIDGIGGGVQPKGKGTISWTVRDDIGRPHVIKAFGYYVPGVKVRLFSAYPYHATS